MPDDRPDRPERPVRTIVLMGVSGSGKTSVGRALAAQLGWRFIDADDFHPPANVEKMRSGRALDDNDRTPWLARLNALLRHAEAKGQCRVLACSALRQRYRDALSDRLPGIAFVHLAGDFELVSARVATRQHHYMPAALLRSQFDALEAPADALTIDIGAPIETAVQTIVRALAPDQSNR